MEYFIGFIGGGVVIGYLSGYFFYGLGGRDEARRCLKILEARRKGSHAE